MPIEFGNPNISKDAFSPIPVRLAYLFAAALVLIAPSWLTPSVYTRPITLGEFELMFFLAAAFLVYKASTTHRETLYSRASESGIAILYSEIPGIFSTRQCFEEFIPWDTVKEINVLENDDAYWLNAVLLNSDGLAAGGRIVDLNPGYLGADEARRAHEQLNRLRLGKAI